MLSADICREHFCVLCWVVPIHVGADSGAEKPNGICIYPKTKNGRKYKIKKLCSILFRRRGVRPKKRTFRKNSEACQKITV